MKLGLFCKTFRRDLQRFERLHESVERYVDAAFPFLVSVPRADLPRFTERFGRRRVDWVTDEDLVGRPIAQSWRTQQVVKFNVWRTGFADAFLMLDSDFYFIRKAYQSDFLAPDGTPRFIVSREWHKYEPSNVRLLSFLCGERELSPVTRAECEQFVVPDRRPGDVSRLRLWLDRVTSPPIVPRIRRIRKVFRPAGPDYHVMPGPIWTRAMHRLFEEFIIERKLDYFDLIQFSPWEYNWTAEWLLAQGLPDAEPAEPLFLHFQLDSDIRDARSRGFRVEDFAKKYLGLTLAANHQDIESY